MPVPICSQFLIFRQEEQPERDMMISCAKVGVKQYGTLSRHNPPIPLH